MFNNIIVPVDLDHVERLDKTLVVAADLARRYGAHVRYVGVAPAAPTHLAARPEGYAARLADFARAQAEAHGIDADGHAVRADDPAADLDATLLAAARADAADLIVIGSHVPGWLDRLWSSHGGAVASRAACSVFVVR